MPGRRAIPVCRQASAQTIGSASRASHLGQLYLVLDRQPPGLRIATHDFKFDERENLPPSEREKAERLANLAPAMFIDAAGAFVRLDNPEPMLKATFESMGMLSEEQQKAMHSVVNAELRTSLALSEWNQQVTAWAGRELELGSVYIIDYEAPLFTGDLVKTHLYSGRHPQDCLQPRRPRPQLRRTVDVHSAGPRRHDGGDPQHDSQGDARGKARRSHARDSEPQR